MKKYVFCLMAAASILAACNSENALIPQDETTPQEAAVSNAKSVKVYAGGPGTKTTITEADGQFSLNWSAGDKIAVWEAVPYIVALQQDPEYNGYVTEKYESQSLTASGAEAVFQLELGERPEAEGNGEIQYVAIYPASCAWNLAGDCWSYEKNRMIMHLEMPTDQNPSADSFDPAADILVSKAVICQNKRPDKLSFQFARVGTIVKMVIADLPPGAFITGGEIDLGFESGYYFSYDHELGRIAASDGTAGISFWYDAPGLKVGDDGKATVWLRSMSGVSDWLELSLDYNYNGPNDAHRIVNLRARGRTLEFKEGGLTEFTIGVPKPDVQNPEEEDIDFFTNDAMDGVTVYWPVSDDEDFGGYECSMVGEDGRWHFPSGNTINNGIYSVTFDSGITPGTYSFFVRTLAVAGKVSQPDCIEVELEIGQPLYSNINYVSGRNSNYPEYGLELDSTDWDDEDLYYGILYHHRNLFWVGGSPNHIKGQSYSKPWGIWNGTSSIRWSKMYVEASSYGSGTYSVYASDTFFQDGLPGDAAALPYTLNADGEKVYDLGNHRYFLICGNNDSAFHFNNIKLEYFK
ncbi:MAG: hypothetical protein IJS70_00935 [Bacteroidales bacterium]|nr:hypothetical protein [Bacteroidales bacterium]